jgi:hypothetical protein
MAYTISVPWRGRRFGLVAVPAAGVFFFGWFTIDG